MPLFHCGIKYRQLLLVKCVDGFLCKRAHESIKECKTPVIEREHNSIWECAILFIESAHDFFFRVDNSAHGKCTQLYF